MNALSIHNLQKTYKNGLTALGGISLDVAEGEFFGLLGPNGAGKTTTIGIITSLVHKTSGTVKVFGIDIDENFPAAKKLIGVVPQELNFGIFEKVEDIVCQQAGYYGIPRTQALERSSYYLNKLGLYEKRHAAARELSGGMKRRLMIARGMVHDPRLLILDEPTAGVDVELRRGMWDFLQELNGKGRTIILTTHYLEEAEQLCSRIAIINRGAIVENAGKRELLRKLQRETFILDSRDPIDQLASPENLELRLIDTTTLEATLDKSQTLNMVFSFLASQNIVIESMRTKSNRLEELFMEMVEE